MRRILKKLNILLDKKQKRQMLLLVPMMLVGAVLETASIALVLSVITAIATPDAVESNKYVALVYNGYL